MESVPKHVWSRRLDAKDPEPSIHSFSRPPALEVLGLLPIAYRVGSYVSTERANGRDPIFDLNGIGLEPPNPGPHGGVPLGGLGGGCIGRGFRGDFRRWSLIPGKYIHRAVHGDVFSIRAKRGNTIWSKVLSVCPPTSSSSPLASWDWSMPASCGTYHALHPRCWTVYENPVPDVTVIIKQVSPFIPHSYSDASLPCGVFQVEVINTHLTADVEVSVMFTFQNGYGDEDDQIGGHAHASFCVKEACESRDTSSSQLGQVVGVCMRRNSLMKRNGNDNRSSSALSNTGTTGTTGTTNTTSSTASTTGSTSPTATPPDDINMDRGASQTHIQANTSSTSSTSSNTVVHATGDAESGSPASFAIAALTHVDIDSNHDKNNYSKNDNTDKIYNDNHKPRTNTCKQAHESTPDDTGQSAVKVSTCSQFIMDATPRSFSLSQLWQCRSDSSSYVLSSARAAAEAVAEEAYQTLQEQDAGFSASAKALWESFTSTGDVQETDWQHGSTPNVSIPGTTVGAAVCQRCTLGPAATTACSNDNHTNATTKNNIAATTTTNNDRRVLSFCLSWDSPMVQFNHLEYALPRYYARFFGTSGFAAPAIALYALRNVGRWEERIETWQRTTLERSHSATACTMDASGPSGAKRAAEVGSSSHSDNDSGSNDRRETSPDERSYYDHQLFNELYFLADGGTVWTDSSNGVPNVGSEPNAPSSAQFTAQQIHHKDSTTLSDAYQGPETYYDILMLRLQEQLSSLQWGDADRTEQLMHRNDAQVQISNGDPALVGQFLYLEGHEYLMYNTYDVHFYSSFALLMLWPQLELSLQRDFALAVPLEDSTMRVMMGDGDRRPRKVKNVVPHDLGSPSEAPWRKPNVYNFQDVSRWKDLGPKFILQVYRNYVHLTRPSSACHGQMDELLCMLYPILLVVMTSTEQHDVNHDGMIENSGFPDQTYDIWTATGVHAYCGGLWITACEAMAKMASLQQDLPNMQRFATLADMSRQVYIAKLWNGQYLDYDSSGGPHSNSIMADMLAGQWYARAARLTPTVTPRMAYTCFKAIYQHNVVDFGAGRHRGAVNGMRPPKYRVREEREGPVQAGSFRFGRNPIDAPIDITMENVQMMSIDSEATVDTSCMQSREVWTGTTYAVAAAMAHEAMHYSSPPTTTTIMDPAATAITPGGISSVEVHSESALSASASTSTSTGTFTRNTTATATATLNSHLVLPANHKFAPATTYHPCQSNSSSSSSSSSSNPIASTTKTTKKLAQRRQQSVSTELLPEERAELLSMSLATARGIHDAGWQEYGYWFATPEGWERNGNYRSLGYMRALCIWAIQFAKEQELDPSDTSHVD